MKRSGGLRRTGPLARKTRLSQRAKRPKRERAAKQDPAYLAFVRTMACRVSVETRSSAQCSGPIHAAHVLVRGLGEKCEDRGAVALCEFHHLRGQHDLVRGGFFCDFSKTERADMYRRWVADTEAAYEAAEVPR